MHILIIELALTGHHSGYLEQIASTYLLDGNTVTVALKSAYSKHTVIKNLETKFGSRFCTELLSDVACEKANHSNWGDIGREISIRKIFGDAYRAVEKRSAIGYVFLPYLDYCLYAVGFLGSPFGKIKWGGICMRPSFHYSQYGVVAPTPKLSFIKRRIFNKLLSGNCLKCLFTIDKLLERYVREFHPVLLKKICYLPDPVEIVGNETYVSAREKLFFNESDKVILVYGSLDERKGLVELTDFILKNPQLATVKLLVAGVIVDSFKLSPGYKNILILVEAGRCILVDRYIEKSEEQSFFAAADVVWLGYKNHYSMSGVLVISAQLSKPIIACRDGLIGWYANHINNATVIDIKNNEQLAFAIDRSFDFPGLVIENEDDIFSGQHSWSNFKSLVLT